MASFGEISDGFNHQMFRELTEEPKIVEDTVDEYVKKINSKPDVSLADGMPLPKYLRNGFPDQLFGRPIHEIDPFYGDKNTFIVVGNNWVIHRFSSMKSLYMLTPLNWLRWFCIRVTTHWTFRIFIIITIIAYAIFHQLMYINDWHLPFLIFFAVEMNLKIIASGFLMQPFSYLRNPWNWIDFILTPVGLILGLMTQHYPVHPIHSLRILRLIHCFTHSRLTYSWMFRSLHRMKDPFLYGAFLFLFFTIYAQQFFSGHLMNRCIQQNLTYSMVPMVYHNVAYVGPSPPNLNVSKVNVTELPYVCGNVSGSRACPDNFVCMSRLENPDNGYTSFDNFPLAAMSIMRLMARDYWDGLYMQIQSALGPKEFPFILTVIVYGGYYYVNLLLAYIAIGITELLEILEGKNPKKKRKVQRNVRVQKSDDLEASEKENASKGIEEKDFSQAVDVSLMNNAPPNHTEEGEEDAIILECVSTSAPSDQKDDNIDEENSNVYKRRRSPFGRFCMPLMDRFCDWNCCPCWVGLQNKLKTVVLSIYFNVFIGLCIFANVVVMTLDHHNMPVNFFYVLHMSELLFGLVYLVEAVLKILALSPRHYFKDSLNRIDFFVVVFLIIEFLFSYIFGLSIFRLFRVLRIFRLTGWWPYFGDLMKICKTNVWALCILTITFVKMAEGIFEYHHLDGDFPYFRWNFKTGMNSVLTVFRMLCGEWIESLWDCLPGSHGLYCIPYFFAVILVGNLALFALFVTMLAVALNSNDFNETEPVHHHNLIAIIKKGCSCCSRFWRPKRLDEQTAEKSREELFNMSADENQAKPSREVQLTFGEDAIAPCWCDACYKFLPCCKSSYQGSTSAASVPADLTPFWRTWRNFRSRSLRLIHNKYFDYGMTAFIILSCFSQAWHDYKLVNFYLHMIFYVMNYLVIVIYPLEMCLQMFGHGCKKYFANGWHVFDFLITLLHLIAMVVTPLTGYSFLLPLGFRPLKLIPRKKRLQVVVSATLNKLSSLLDVVLACGLLWLFFAIWGVQMFSGGLFFCMNAIDESILPVYEINNKRECLAAYGNNSNIHWMTSYYNFDDIGNAFGSLIQVASMKGWLTIIHSTMDSRGVDMQPAREINLGMSWYYISFFVLGVLCCFTLILATFLKKNNEQRKQITGGYIEILMTEDQKKEFAMKKGSFFISPVKVSPCPELRLRRFAYQLVISSQFKLMVILVTSINAIGLACITLEASILMDMAIFYIEILFYLAFMLEVILRITAFGRNFFNRRWNIYDLAVLVISFFVYALHPLFPHYVPTPLILGLLRIIRLVRWLKWVRRIASRLMLYLTALNNVAFLLFVLILTYASMAIVMYQHTPIDSELTDHVDFAYLGSAMLCFTMMGFGSSWDIVIQSYEGSRWFILSFLAVFYLVLLEAGAVLFLEHYHLLNRKRRMNLSDDALEAFETGWKILDPDATGYIACNHLPEFLHAMPPPLQIAKPIADQIADLDFPIYKGDNVAFKDVLLTILDRLDDREKFDRTELQNRDDVISSTLKRQQETDAKSDEQELVVN